VVGIVVLAVTAITARSVALAGFGLDSLIEIGASAVVIWELSGTGQARQRWALRLIGAAFALLAVYLAVQATLVLATGYHPQPSTGGIVWTSLTAVVMFALAFGKACTGAARSNPVLTTEGAGHPDRRAARRRGAGRAGAQRRTGLVVGRPPRRVRVARLRRPRGPRHLRR
jgi:hypothetical protein